MAKCNICKERIREYPHREDGSIRTGSNGRYWCKECIENWSDIDSHMEEKPLTPDELPL